MSDNIFFLYKDEKIKNLSTRANILWPSNGSLDYVVLNIGYAEGMWQVWFARVDDKLTSEAYNLIAESTFSLNHALNRLNVLLINRENEQQAINERLSILETSLFSD